jgi:hypothetical protein
MIDPFGVLSFTMFTSAEEKYTKKCGQKLYDTKTTGVIVKKGPLT